MTDQDSNKQTIICLLGPTASGKSDILQELSKKIQIELISADSVQVYRGLDIGSAKPDLKERSCFTHHLIDIKNFDEAFSVGDFYQEAENAVSKIIKNKHTPVLSGGTVFYVKNFLYGLCETPESDEAIRQEFQEELERNGLPKLYERLLEIDEKYAKKIASSDKQRILRALEIHKLTGKKVSDFEIKSELRQDYNFKLYAIHFERTELKDRIKRRIEKMFDLGLEDEIHSLKEKGATGDMQSMKAIGYREFFTPEFTTADEIKEAIYSSTIKYAKRQMTFLNSLENLCWCSKDEMLDKILSDLKA